MWVNLIYWAFCCVQLEMSCCTQGFILQLSIYVVVSLSAVIRVTTALKRSCIGVNCRL